MARDQGKQDKLRAERDRFVALAFCWADILLELTPDRRVVFAGGATVAVLGCQPEDLKGRDALELVAAEDRVTMRELMRQAAEAGRIEQAAIRLVGKNGATPPLTISGYRLADLEGHYFLAFRVDPVRPCSPATVLRDTESGLHSADFFSSIAQDALDLARERGEEAQLTLINLKDFESLRNRMATDAQQELQGRIGTLLRVNSLFGDSAARLGDDRYGLLHRKAMNIESLRHQIEDYTREADPEGKGSSVDGATLEMDAAGLSDDKMSKALAYTINRFHEREGAGFNIRSLSSSLAELAAETLRSVKAFRQVVSESDFDIAFQPIVRIPDADLHHFEVLARFRNSAEDSPYRTITFAEEVGLICDFDLAMVQRVIKWLTGPGRDYPRVVLAVNISGYSLGTLAFIAELHGLLKLYPNLGNRLMFEVTETVRINDLDSANRFIQSLRNSGYKVCLDDFGAGAANFQYLGALEVDVVKIDGAAVQNSRYTPKGRPFLKALANLCRDLSISTIAEMVDDQRTLDFVRDCAIGYAQGYLFGKPAKDIREFLEPQPKNAARRRR